jgi:hypothetical protein
VFRHYVYIIKHFHNGLFLAFWAWSPIVVPSREISQSVEVSFCHDCLTGMLPAIRMSEPESSQSFPFYTKNNSYNSFPDKRMANIILLVTVPPRYNNYHPYSNHSILLR